MMIMFALVFLAVTLGLAGLYLWWMPSEAERRLQVLAPAPDTSWTETVVKLVGPFAQLSSPTGEEEASPLRLKFLNAGIRHNDASLIYFGLKSLLPVVFAAAAFVIVRSTRQVEGLRHDFRQRRRRW